MKTKRSSLSRRELTRSPSEYLKSIWLDVVPPLPLAIKFGHQFMGPDRLPTAPAYLPMGGNDFAFATPPQLDGEPVVAPLGPRCSLCHGRGPGVGHLVTFAQHTFPGRPAPPVVRLVSAQNVHAGDVARRKMELEEFKALRSHWQ